MKDPCAVIPIHKVLRKFKINFDVRHYNGFIEIEATDEDDARRQFDDLPLDALIEKTEDIAAEIENVA